MKGIHGRLKSPLISALFGMAILLLPARPQQAQEKPPAQSPPPVQQTALPQAAPEQPELKLRSFGYDLFKATAGPISEGPVDENYVISPGDEIIIRTWGQLILNYELTVTEEGFLELDKGESGRIFTNAVTLKNLKGEVTRVLALKNASYINAEDPSKSSAFVEVKLKKIRKLLIYAVGEVANPGAYTLSSGTATIINLLHNAGGVREAGTLREIRIRRANGSSDLIDLYDFLLTGKLDVKKSQLQAGDYVIVPLKQKAVEIGGEVRRPMKYELIGTEGIRELVSFAGGFNPDAYLLRAQLKRSEINRGEVFLDLNLSDLARDPKWNYALADRDELTIFPNVQVRKSMVELSGDGVVRPGTYEFKPGMTVSQLIEKAEGLREYVYLDRADLIRTEPDFSKKLTTFSLKDLYKEDKPGVFKFTGNKEKDFVLKEMDLIAVYSAYGMAGKDKFAKIEGQVKDPGRFMLAKNMTLYDFVFARGGFQDSDFRRTAFMDLAHVIRKIPGQIGQKLIPFNLGKLLDGDPAVNFKLEDDDVIRIYSNEQMQMKSTVQISGLINKSGKYDFTEDLTIEDLIVLAGGLTAEAYKVEAVIARREATGTDPTASGRGEATIHIPVAAGYAVLPQDKKTPLKAYDRIVVRNYPDWEPLPVVALRGEILYPGEYTLISRDEKISSVIQRAGGLRKEALPEGAMILRNRNVLRMVPGESDMAFEITLNLAGALKEPGGKYDIVMKDGDIVFIPRNPGTVEVRGAVQRPLILQYKEGLGVRDYIKLCGDFLKTADKNNIIVIAANSETRKVGRGLFGNANPSVSPGSLIQVAFIGQETKLETVEVRGEVLKPAVIQHFQGALLGFYLNVCGGFTKDADLNSIAIHLPEGGVLVKKGNQEFNPVVPPGSVIVVMAKTAAAEKK